LIVAWIDGHENSVDTERLYVMQGKTQTHPIRRYPEKTKEETNEMRATIAAKIQKQI
jgi:hypothetical protein